MGIVDCNGLPVAIEIESATPHETQLTEKTVKELFINVKIGKLIGDKAYDSDSLDERLAKNKIELIAPHKSNRVNKTQDGRKLRPYKNRWKVERFFAWLQNFRRIVVRYEIKAVNFKAMVLLGCAMIFMHRM